MPSRVPKNVIGRFYWKVVMRRPVLNVVGVPLFIACFVEPVVARHLELSPFGAALSFVVILLLSMAAVVAILAALSRTLSSKEET